MTVDQIRRRWNVTQEEAEQITDLATQLVSKRVAANHDEAIFRIMQVITTGMDPIETIYVNTWVNS